MALQLTPKWFLFCGCLGLLSSCATLSRDECKVAQWREVGYTDAAQGYSAARVADHRSACARVNVAVNLADYTAGYDEGLKLYCQPSVAYRLASQGQAYSSQCTVKRFPSLRPAYNQGVVYYQLQQERTALHHKHQEKQEQLKALNEQINNQRDKQQNALKSLRADLYQEIAQIEQQIKQLDEQLLQAQQRSVH